MMFAIKDGDLHVVNGEIQAVEGAEEIRQHIEIRLGLWRGEAFYNVDEGVDYADLVMPAQDRRDVLGELRRVVLGTPGVLTCSLQIVSQGPATLTVRGQFTASISARDDLIRQEFGPITITGEG